MEPIQAWARPVRGSGITGLRRGHPSASLRSRQTTSAKGPMAMGRITIEVGGAPTTCGEQRALRVGREPGSDLMLDAPTVSRNHAEFRPVGDGWEVVDLGSTHGTWVNGQRVTQMPLAPGTTIVRFGLTDGGATANVTLEGAPAVA